MDVKYRKKNNVNEKNRRNTFFIRGFFILLQAKIPVTRLKEV
mgnify:CR=1 FL=1